MITQKWTGRLGGALIAGIILLSCAVGLNSLLQLQKRETRADSRPEAVPTEVVAVQERPFSRQLSLTGSIMPKETVQVFSKVPGKIIQRIAVDEGDAVEKGRVLVQLEQESIEASIQEARAGLKGSRAELRRAESRLQVLKKDTQRLENLFQEKAVAAQKLDHIKAEYQAALENKNSAQAGIERAKARLRQLLITGAEHTINAPISGLVAKRHLDPGSLTTPGLPLLTLIQTDPVKILTSVSEQDYPGLHKGMPARTTVDAFPGEVFTGRVSLVSPTLEQATRTAALEISIPNPGQKLKSGMFAQLEIETGSSRGLAVPLAALLQMPGTAGYYVFCVREGRAVQVNVSIGDRQGRFVRISKGLQAGDRVVIKGQNRLEDQTPVRVLEEDSP